MLERRNVVLKNPEHIYTDVENIRHRYTSVTQSLKKVTPKFKDEYWQTYKALQAGGYKVTPDIGRWKTIGVNGIAISLDSLLSGVIPMEVTHLDIANKWKEITDIACNKGNKVHDQLEHGSKSTQNIIKRKHTHSDIIPFYTIRKNFPQVYQKIRESLDAGYRAFPEKIVYIYDDAIDFYLAGMIDMPLFNGRRFRIKDWKTNKADLRFEAGYFKKDADGNVTERWIATNERMLYPISHLEVSIGNKYALQLSLYAYILELWGFELEPDGLELCHIRGEYVNTEMHNPEYPELYEEEVFVPTEIKWHLVPYLKEEAKAIVEFMKLPEAEQKRLQQLQTETINF